MKRQRNTLGKNVARLRTAAGWTQAELADAAGLSQGAVSKIEAGRTTPSIAIVGRLAKSLYVTLDEIFYRSGVDNYSKSNKV